ncbi:hypothetical protein Daus18300_001208 [Diaporthe australafricana]|uniref:Fork-head domain-containing protein n=1 Tax=Diaporthe australafricana TaxID=127596 RepID=A0ABR3XY81_9PEZI
MMIQQQTSPFLTQDLSRMLPSLSQTRQDRLRLERLADAAVCLQEPGVYTPASSPSTPDFHEFTFGHSIPDSSESKSFGIPSVQSLFAIADGEPPRSYGFDPPCHQPSFRRPSTGSESSFLGVPELSRLSTASPPPRLVPRTPEAHFSIAPQSDLKIELRLGDHQTATHKRPEYLQAELEEAASINRRILLEPARSRRPSSRQSPYSTAAADKGRRGSSKNRADGEAGTPLKGKQKPPHFNLRYSKSVKLFILYHKEDCGWGWKAINKRRVDLLPVLYREGYKPEIERNRQVAGINGFYYRLNEVMPALTPDGSGLRFVEHDGRSWELTVPSKCRGAKEKKKGKAEGDVDARPRGMVDRYPEEVIYHWDEFVKHFVPLGRHAEVYARAKRYCEIRAEQRREMGVPQWTPDNESDRVKHTCPPETRKTKGSQGDEALPELMRACALDAAEKK